MLKVWIPAIFLWGCVLTIIYENYASDLRLAPSGLGIWWIIYSKEQTWGWGPGGNETGVVAFALPEDAAETIQRRGATYLSESDKRCSHWCYEHGRYRTWSPTPIDNSSLPWRTTQAAATQAMQQGRPIPEDSAPDLVNAISIYGFTIDVDAAIRQQINRIVSSPGAFYSHGRIGTVIVSPSERRAFLVYAG